MSQCTVLSQSQSFNIELLFRNIQGQHLFCQFCWIVSYNSFLRFFLICPYCAVHFPLTFFLCKISFQLRIIEKGKKAYGTNKLARCVCTNDFCLVIVCNTFFVLRSGVGSSIKVNVGSKHQICYHSFFCFKLSGSQFSQRPELPLQLAFGK